MSQVLSQNGHSRIAAEIARRQQVPRPVVGWAIDYPDGYVIPPHSHPRAQLVYAAAGVMTVRTDQGLWVIPPQRAVWMPAGVEHQVHASGTLAMRTVYVEAGGERRYPGTCRVLTVGPLLRQLILRAVAMPALYPLGGPEERLMMVLLDEIAALPEAPLHLPVPRDRRLRRITDALLADPAGGRTLKDWAASSGASVRTLARRFVRETGMTFGAWRQQLRLLRALEYLAEGRPVTQVALDLGYDSPSAFSAMFRRTLGVPPSRYFGP